MKLTKGRRLVFIQQDEMIITATEFEMSVNSAIANKQKNMEKELIESYQIGLKDRLNRKKEYALILPSIIKDENKHLVDVVSSIASELLEQGDIESCEWLFNKIHQCRSL